MKNIRKRKLNNQLRTNGKQTYQKKNNNLNEGGIQKRFFFKIAYLTLVITLGLVIMQQNNTHKYIADYLNTLTTKQILLDNVNEIQDNYLDWPLKEITNWGKVNEYKTIQFTNWANLDNGYKTPFPSDITNFIEKYRYVSPYNVWSSITDPLERDKLILYKRLITTTWTASYSCNTENCNWWIPNSGTHAGVDFVSSINTPVYSIANGIVMDIKTPCIDGKCDGFGNYIIIGTNLDGRLYATFYAHLNSLNDKLKIGDLVKRGDSIGYLGNSGNSTAPHLHLQINNLGTIGEIKSLDVASKLFEGWFHNLEGVRLSTVDPIEFIDNYNNVILNNTVESNNDDNGKIETIPENNIIENITPEKPEELSSFKIKDIIIENDESKLKLGEEINATIVTDGKEGKITIATKNNVIKPSKFEIIPIEGDNNHNITLVTNKIGNTEILFDDGESVKSKYFSVYETNASDIYGIEMEGSEYIYTTSQVEYRLFPIDELGNRMSVSLNGTFIVSLINKSNGDVVNIGEFQNIDNNDFKLFIKAPDKNNYKIKVYFKGNNENLFVTKNTETKFFKDYSFDEKYVNGMEYLMNKNILTGIDGNLKPGNNITRGEIITLIIRSLYGDKYETYKNEMNEFIKSKGRFFSDISGNEWHAPYIFIGYKNGIIKGSEGKALAENNIVKAELIAIYSRSFGYNQDDFGSLWKDVNNSHWFKNYAQIAKRYNLYPFDNNDYFNGFETINRLNALESLFRYITNDKKIIIESTNDSKNYEEKTVEDSNIIPSSSDEKANNDDELKSLFKDLINY